ncbi:hypothetical protein D3C71_1657230 [compost metagenome]
MAIPEMFGLHEFFIGANRFIKQFLFGNLANETGQQLEPVTNALHDHCYMTRWLLLPILDESSFTGTTRTLRVDDFIILRGFNTIGQTDDFTHVEICFDQNLIIHNQSRDDLFQEWHNRCMRLHVFTVNVNYDSIGGLDMHLKTLCSVLMTTG